MSDFRSSDSLDLLRELTENLPVEGPAFPREIASAPGFKEHKMSCGTSFSWDLLTRDEVSCAHWFNSSGTIFPEHVHEQREWLIVFIGSMILQLDGEESERLLPGQYRVIEPGLKHKAKFLEDCHYLSITIPKSSDWPQR